MEQIKKLQIQSWQFLFIQLQNEKHAWYPAAYIHIMQFRGGCLASGERQRVSVLSLLQMYVLGFFFQHRA